MNINLKEENDKLKTWMIQMTLDTVFFYPRFMCWNSKKFIFSLKDCGNIYIIVLKLIWALEHSKCHFRSKCPYSTQSWPNVKISQNYTEIAFSMFLHQTRGYWIFLPTLTKFNIRLTTVSDQKSNFDPTIRIGWNQRHCK